METLSNKAPSRKQLENRISELEKLLEHSVRRGEEAQHIVDFHRKTTNNNVAYIKQLTLLVEVTLDKINASAALIADASRHVSEEELSASVHKIQSEVQKQAGAIIDCQNTLNALSAERSNELLNGGTF